MDDMLRLGIIIATLVVVAGFMGYKIYLNYKKDTPAPDEMGLVKLINFILSNIDYFINALQDTMDDLNGINIEDCKNDAEYRQRLIETAISIIEKSANEVGITFSLSHSTLVNLAEIIIDKLIERAEADAEVLLEEAPKSDSVDITKEIEDFYT